MKLLWSSDNLKYIQNFIATYKLPCGNLGSTLKKFLTTYKLLHGSLKLINIYIWQSCDAMW